jgi:hypothetical protein
MIQIELQRCCTLGAIESHSCVNGDVMGEDSGVTKIPFGLVVYSVATGGMFTQLCI